MLLPPIFALHAARPIPAPLIARPTPAALVARPIPALLVADASRASPQAYTASILTFLFTNAGKPIVVTGAQVPLSQPRSDGWTNILDSLFVAGILPYAGVGVVFHHQVFHGAR